MGRPKGWASEQTGRPVERSPGRPPAGRREHRVRFWEAIARGATSEAAGVEAGVSPAVGVRWFREGGGMPSVTQAPLSGRYLSFDMRPAYHRREDRIEAHVQLCWLALLLMRVAETETDHTWRNLRNALDRMHLVTLATTEGTVSQRTELTTGHRRILGALQLPEPPRFYDFTPTAE